MLNIKNIKHILLQLPRDYTLHGKNFPEILMTIQFLGKEFNLLVLFNSELNS